MHAHNQPAPFTKSAPPDSKISSQVNNGNGH